MFVLGSEWQRVGDLPVFLPPPADGCSSLGQPRGGGGQLSEYTIAGPWLKGVTLAHQ